ncbi:hypothetical protein J1605_013177 [Eschrichtius robustus]|uniref:Uncharacterized protein n=1 Tax=Eschrichtius robustus TaxID=9764 RepID=A0AB34GIM0_ESCRO|nr:hypothetical protein J1605_013177 [Eschrichtius robustus]
MAHLRACEVRQLLRNKFVVVMGDPMQRAVYKDLVLLLQKDCLLSSSQLKAKGELSFERNVPRESGRWERLHSCTHYRDVRRFCSRHHLVRPGFPEELPGGLREPVRAPGQSAARGLPPGVDGPTGGGGRLRGFLLPEDLFRGARLREEVIEANFYSSAEASRYGFDMLDLHFHFRHAGQHRQRAGVHWDRRAHCHLSQLLLARLADAWDVDRPCRHPVGRWIRDGPTRGLPGPVDGRQPRDSRGDPGEQPLSWFPATSACLRGDLRNPFPGRDLRSSPTAKAPVCPTTHLHSVGNSPVILQHARSDTHWRSKLDDWPGDTSGPILRTSTQHRSRRSPPYPPRCPSGPRRRQRRRTNRRTQAHP